LGPTGRKSGSQESRVVLHSLYVQKMLPINLLYMTSWDV